MQISNSFRTAHVANDTARMVDLSQDGVELLRILALAIRSEQDYRLVTPAPTVVGALLPNVADVDVFMAEYVPPHQSLLLGPEGSELRVRNALNKIAHANPTRSTYRATQAIHELVLTGTRAAQQWIAVISLPKLCDAIHQLDDRAVRAT